MTDQYWKILFGLVFSPDVTYKTTKFRPFIQTNERPCCFQTIHNSATNWWAKLAVLVVLLILHIRQLRDNYSFLSVSASISFSISVSVSVSVSASVMLLIRQLGDNDWLLVLRWASGQTTQFIWLKLSNRNQLSIYQSINFSTIKLSIINLSISKLSVINLSIIHLYMH